MATIEIDRDLMAELMYESAMYKLYCIEQLMLVKDIWNSTDPEPVIEETVKEKKKPKNGLVEVERFK